jgi:hypothetical protein
MHRSPTVIPGDIRAIIKGTKLDTGSFRDSLYGMEPGREFSSNSLQNHWITLIAFVGCLCCLL